MAKKKRITRKQLLKEPDEFLTFSAKAIQFIARNRRSVLGAVTAFVVFVVAFAGFRYYSQGAERKAFALVEQARLSFLAQTVGGAEASADDDMVQKLETVIEEYPSTSAARHALLVYGNVSYARGDYTKAIELYAKALDAFAEDTFIEKMVWNGMGHAYEARQDFSSAAEHFKKMGEAPGEFMKREGQYNLGRMLEALDDPKGALEAYARALEGEKGPADFPLAEEKVSRLQAALGVSP